MRTVPVLGWDRELFPRQFRRDETPADSENPRDFRRGRVLQRLLQVFPFDGGPAAAADE